MDIGRGNNLEIARICGVAAGALSVGAALPYFRSILNGSTKPSPISWGIWAVLGFVLLLSYRASGADETIWLAAGYFLVPFAVFLLSLRRGDIVFSPLEIICVAFTILGCIAWALFKSAYLTVLIYLMIDAVGAVPTLRKAYAEPWSENLEGWLIGFAASAINLFAVNDWSLRISLYPLYAFTCTGSIAAILLIRRRYFSGEQEATN